MSKKMHIVSKGLYRGEGEKNSLLDVNEYVFVRENGKKYLLLRFTNKSDFHITAMTFRLIQKNSDGREIGERKVSLTNLRCVAWETFSPEKGLLVDDKCADIDIKMISVVSGNYEYRSKNGESFVRYDFQDRKLKRIDKDPVCIQHSKLNRKVKFTGIILVLALVLTLVAIFTPIFTEYVIPAIFNAIKALFESIGELFSNIGKDSGSSAQVIRN